MTLIAVTGATGFVGQTLLDEALGQGIEIRALVRRPQPARAGVTWIAGDLADHAALRAVMDGCEAVIHVAGVVNARDRAAFEVGNVNGTLAVIEAMRATGVQRLVHVSSLSAREPSLSAYGASKAKAEALIRASGLDWTMVRPPAIYGPRDRDMFELFRAAKWGVVPVPAQGRASMIHVADLARLLVALIPAREATEHELYEVDDGKRGGWAHGEMARVIGWAVGRRPYILKLSKKVMERAARADMFVRRGKARMTLDRAGYMAHPDWTVSAGARVPGQIWRPQTETRAGLKATAQWYREAGWL